MSDKPFRFKEFTIAQDQCAMKVGTDGVLLGAWADISGNPFSVLDIGAGTGLIALMLAQRSNAELIDALEIDGPAHGQCVENFENSPWNDRLFCYHASLQEFAEEIEDSYDLIVSNPPFYTENVSSGNKQRDLARATQALSFTDLLDAVAVLLSETGSFHVILPFKEELEFREMAAARRLYPYRMTRVAGTEEKKNDMKRSLLSFAFGAQDLKSDELVIEKERHQYTDRYIELTRDFYLNM